MAMSGIEIDSEIPTLFNEMKLRSTHKWATFMIEKKKKIVVDHRADPCKTEDLEADKEQFEALKKYLKDLNMAPRYVLYDFGFTNKEGRKINKIAFIFYCDDDAKIGDKMIYASTKDTIKKAFTGLSLEFQANDMAEVDYDAMSDEVAKKA